jgi:stage III sporulation protein AG
MLTLDRGPETVFAVDSQTSSSILQEEDAQGGTRYQTSQTRNDQTLVVTGKPVVVTETIPTVRGVIIIAEGGGDLRVRDALMRATSGLLGVGIHRVHVLPMTERR